ncbi:hypothetical protein F53441_9701 [Fusarium austroafricanum]|uniref:Dickkopf N-terminal cysteine-rich domain-containing protein n=1 Tax=Fusarium austroafricanum TaxID=2364996 RepID=A0A8H4KAF4_9HYPO|nr:hypothetical protein F53441_9701 [Fusarium austroafricanum]
MQFLSKALLFALVSGAASVALAAPEAINSGVDIAQRDESEAIAYKREELEDDVEDEDEDVSENDDTDVLSKLDARATKCYTRGRPGKNCYHSQCPGNKQCKVNARGNCVFRYSQKKRPFGCSQCLCYKASG